MILKKKKVIISQHAFFWDYDGEIDQVGPLHKTIYKLPNLFFHGYKLEIEELQKIQHLDTIELIMLPFSTSSFLLCLFHK
jgi:hypothetical protein